MLLRLSEPADITEFVRVLSLPTEEPELESLCLASGWGSIRPDKCVPGPDPIPWSRKHSSGRNWAAGPLGCWVPAMAVFSWPTAIRARKLQCVDVYLVSDDDCKTVICRG